MEVYAGYVNSQSIEKLKRSDRTAFLQHSGIDYPREHSQQGQAQIYDDTAHKVSVFPAKKQRMNACSHKIAHKTNERTVKQD